MGSTKTNNSKASEREMAAEPAVAASARTTRSRTRKVAATKKGAPSAEKTNGARKTEKAVSAKKEAGEKRKKIKLIRDSFAMPASEYSLIAALKERCLAKGIVVKKSEVLRAAIANFSALSDAAVGKAVAGLAPIKTGRPPKHAK